MPLVTVIMPTRRRPELLPRAVASVMRQSLTDWELIVVDDNDAGEMRVRAHAEAAAWLADPRVVLLENPTPSGASRARNLGLRAAQGRYVTFLDDDDAYAPDKLQRQLQLANATGAPLVLCGATYHLHQRLRHVQCDCSVWRGDDLLVRARWGSPLFFHRRVDGVEFDEALRAGEDLVYVHALLARFGVTEVPVVPAPLVDVYPQFGPRVNATPQPWQRVAKRVLRSSGTRFSRNARSRFVLQLQLAACKLGGDPWGSWRVARRLMIASRGADWRFAINACVSAAGWGRGRWVA